MTETTTPTDEVVDQSSSDIRDESLLDDNNNNSAVEDTNDTDSSDKTTQDSDSTQSSTEEASSDEDITAFAKSQGYDPENLSDNEKKLLTQLKKQSVEKRKEIDKEASKKLDKAIEDVAPNDEDADAKTLIKNLEAKLAARDAKETFWEQNPGDRKYETKMGELLREEEANLGKAAAWQLANNLPRLLREAKYQDGLLDSDAARDAGRREEREDLRKKQEGGADRADATTSSSSSKEKIGPTWTQNTYDPNKPEHRKMLDEAIANGTYGD